MKMKITNKYVRQGLMLFLVGLALIVAYFIIHNTDSIGRGISTINGILTPFYIGIIMAYLLCPVYNWVVRSTYKVLNPRFKKKTTTYKISRFLGTLLALGTLIIAIVGFFYLIIPDLVESIVGIISNLPAAVDKINEWFKENIQENPQLLELLQGNLETLTDNLLAWFQDTFMPGAQTLISGVSTGIIGTVNGVLDVFIALIICVYILNSKELFQAQAKKMILAVCKPERAKSIFELGKISNETFGGFINGKIIDSLIIGILCFIVMNIMQLPMATLISVIVGVTNVIPFFGPFIGAIPSIILLLIIDPIAALKFAIMVLILQQVDGNIIGPKILGDTTGLASFWVMFAIIVGGGLFGFVGMILGVPLFAIFYLYVSRLVEGRLRRRGMQTDTAVYEELTKYNINKEDIFGKDRCNPGMQTGDTREEGTSVASNTGTED